MADIPPPPNADNPPTLRQPPSFPISDHNKNEQHDSSRASSVLSDPPSSPVAATPTDNLPMLRSRSNRRAPNQASDLKDDTAEAGPAEEDSDDGEESDDSFSLASGKKRKTSVKNKKKGRNNSKRAKKEKEKVKVKKTKEEMKQDRAEARKNRFVAKVGVCRDLPNWGDREDVPLMKLPLEVLDRCFGSGSSLALRDWISLAGVNKFFRHHLDDQFFHEVWYLRSERVIAEEPKMYKVYNRQKYVYEINSHNRPDGHPALRPFTRDIKPWWKDSNAQPESATSDNTSAQPEGPNHKADAANKAAKLQHYTPRGPRVKWTREQYTVYREEKARYNQRERKKRIKRAEEAAAKARQARKSRRVAIGNAVQATRSVRVLVDGRLDGEKPVETDDNGLPVLLSPSVYPSSMDDGIGNKTDESIDTCITTKARIGPDAKKLWDAAKVPRWLRDLAEPWVVPDSDGEDDLEPEVIKRYDSEGKPIAHDYWPSKWRNLVAAEVNGLWTHETHAASAFRVDRAELLSLRHVYLHGCGSSKYFLTAAVEALALRAHGGYDGHREYKTECDKKAARAADARANRRGEKREDARRQRKHILTPYGQRMLAQHGGRPRDYCSIHCWCDGFFGFW